MKPVQQGDVLIKPVNGIPEGARKVKRENGRLILARGENTGHTHAIADRGCELWEIERNGAREFYLEVIAPEVTLVHEEHKPQLLEKGFALIDAKRELDFYEGFERRVQD